MKWQLHSISIKFDARERSVPPARSDAAARRSQRALRRALRAAVSNSGQAKANIGVPTPWGVPEAKGRAQVPRIVAPPISAADDAAPWATCVLAGCAIGGRAVIIVGPRILAPFPHIAVHLVKAPRIRRQAAYCHRPSVEFTARSNLTLGNSIPESELRRRTRSARVRRSRGAAAVHYRMLPCRHRARPS